MKGIILTFCILAGLFVIAPLVIILKIGLETIANIFNRFIDWLTSFVPDWIKGK